MLFKFKFLQAKRENRQARLSRFVSFVSLAAPHQSLPHRVASTFSTTSPSIADLRLRQSRDQVKVLLLDW